MSHRYGRLGDIGFRPSIASGVRAIVLWKLFKTVADTKKVKIPLWKVLLEFHVATV